MRNPRFWNEESTFSGMRNPYFSSCCPIITTSKMATRRHLDFFLSYCDRNFKNILKAKSNFTLLLYIPFLGIGEWYFKCV